MMYVASNFIYLEFYGWLQNFGVYMVQLTHKLIGTLDKFH